MNVAAAQESHHHRPVDTALIREFLSVAVNLALAGNADIDSIHCIDEASVHILLINIAVIMRVLRKIADVRAGKQHC
ncbi:hypothetical protein D3C72_2413420 [compost metagenome]